MHSSEENQKLQQRILELENENQEMKKVIKFTLRTIRNDRDETINPLAKMCDRVNVEKMLAKYDD